MPWVGSKLKQVVNETLRAGLQPGGGSPPRRYRLKPASLGQTKPVVDLNKALSLAEALEDEAILQKLEQRR